MKVYPEFQQMRLIGALCDAKIVCNGRYFLAHKVVLAGAVPYFHVMFTGDFLEGHSGEINISGEWEWRLYCSRWRKLLEKC